MNDNEKMITLSFSLEQVCNDILTKCNQISKTVRDEALEDIRADVQTPDDPESRSIINRALTEAFGDLKTAMQRYLKTGRTSDNNLLERIVSDRTYVQARDTNGKLLYTCKVSGTDTVVYEDSVGVYKRESDGSSVTPDAGTLAPIWSSEIDTLTYETVTLVLYIPNFNVSVTAALESNSHKYLVEYALSQFLSDQLADKGAEYAEKANLTYGKVLKNLNSRDRFNMRKPSWI